MPAPPRDPADAAGADEDHAPESEPLSSRSAVAVVPIAAEDSEQPPDSGPRPRTVQEGLRDFMDSGKKGRGIEFIRRVIVRKLYGPSPKQEQIDEELVGEIASRASLRVLEAKTPPWTVRAIPAWVRRVTRCEVADYFKGKGRRRDRKNLDRGADVAQWADRHAPGADWGAREHLIIKWLEGQIGQSPTKKETFRLMFEHHVVGRSLEDLARENATTAQALAGRFHRLRSELGPKASIMDREKPRRAILPLLFFGGLALVVAIVFALWRAMSPVPPPQPPPPVPVPSATASVVPTFDQALPPRNVGPAPSDTESKEPGKRR